MTVPKYSALRFVSCYREASNATFLAWGWCVGYQVACCVKTSVRFGHATLRHRGEHNGQSTLDQDQVEGLGRSQPSGRPLCLLPLENHGGRRKMRRPCVDERRQLWFPSRLVCY
jgi:hypothetical protein